MASLDVVVLTGHGCGINMELFNVSARAVAWVPQRHSPSIFNLRFIEWEIISHTLSILLHISI